MSFQVIKSYNSFEADEVLDTNDIRNESCFSNPEFVLHCVESELDENSTLDDIFTQFNN